MTDPELTAALHLLEVDYERTTKFIEGVLSTSSSIRGWTITLTVALLGIAFERQSWMLGVGAVLLILMFALVDAYHSWLYSDLVKHVHYVEKTLGLYYASLASDGDADVRLEFDVQLRMHRIGPFQSLRKFSLARLLDARPRILLVTLYGALLAIAIAATVIVHHRGRTAALALSCVAVNGTPGTLTCTTK